MKEAKEVAKEFKHDLLLLMKKYKAIIELEAKPTKHGYSVLDTTIKVYIPADYREDGKCLAEWTEIDLGNYLDYGETEL